MHAISELGCIYNAFIIYYTTVNIIGITSSDAHIAVIHYDIIQDAMSNDLVDKTVNSLSYRRDYDLFIDDKIQVNNCRDIYNHDCAANLNGSTEIYRSILYNIIIHHYLPQE